MRNDRTFEKILTVGPDISGLGGISAVLRTYADIVPGFTFLPSNSRRGTLRGAFVLLGTMLRLPLYRLRGYRIIHAQGASGKSFTRKRMLMGWARHLGYRTIFHNHGGGFREFAAKTGKDRISAILGRCDAVAVLTPAWKEYFEKELGCRHVAVLPNPVIPPARPVTRPALRPGEPLKAVFLGKICRDKGVWDLLEAVARRRDELDGRLEIVMAGNGEAETLRRRIADLGISSIVKYAGGVFGDEKDALLRASRLMILPSYVEGVPITLLEAGVYGMASLTTPVGGIPDLITDGENGTLVAPGDVDAFADALVRYAANPSLAVEQGRQAPARVAPHLPEALREALSNLYNAIK
ncbi:MAG: glycosyltransferase family 4 protein [Bacteroidales bacterium]|nr:glycosyltransferase family 4 protein [Bacteroidales bacterium]